MARERARAEFPLRAVIAVVGYVARKPLAVRVGTGRVDAERADIGQQQSNAGFLDVPEPSADIQRLYDDDVDEVGYVMNVSKLWAHQPTAQEGLFGLLRQASRAASRAIKRLLFLSTVG